jgi:hypothetical protein
VAEAEVGARGRTDHSDRRARHASRSRLTSSSDAVDPKKFAEKRSKLVLEQVDAAAGVADVILEDAKAT